MGKITQALAAILLMSVILFSASAVFAENNPVVQEDNHPAAQKEQVQVELTAAQKLELEALYTQMFSAKKTIISKYVEYGVIPEEKAKHMLSRLEKHHEMLKQNGFIPKWKHCSKSVRPMD